MSWEKYKFRPRPDPKELNSNARQLCEMLPREITLTGDDFPSSAEDLMERFESNSFVSLRRSRSEMNWLLLVKLWSLLNHSSGTYSFKTFILREFSDASISGVRKNDGVRGRISWVFDDEDGGIFDHEKVETLEKRAYGQVSEYSPVTRGLFDSINDVLVSRGLQSQTMGSPSDNEDIRLFLDQWRGEFVQRYGEEI
ncbi:MAG: hypothetical protein NUV69_03245 [Candidatus Curtissbacteria bacterium]|nr:hypothetical protein [Candidatus Curtissbacteria bacterium]